jgi:hypothetical protein
MVEVFCSLSTGLWVFLANAKDATKSTHREITRVFFITYSPIVAEKESEYAKPNLTVVSRQGYTLQTETFACSTPFVRFSE